jgi:hypothetical protein
MRIIKPKVMSMPEGSDLKEIADGNQGSTIVSIDFVPVDTVVISPDWLWIHGVKVIRLTD